MPKARLNTIWSAVGLACALSTISTALAAQPASDGLQPGQVARALAGEWQGQIQVRAADGDLSTAPASMSARLRAHDQSLHIYYEGFAFGQPVEGALRFSFDEENPEARLLDDAANVEATCRADDDAQAQANAYHLSCEQDGAEQFRVVFSKLDAKSWNIAYELRDEQGEWSQLVLLQLDRMGLGEMSAAADNFDRTPLFTQLDTAPAFAIVETGD